MTLRLSVPSKTFLVGEYAVLTGGEGLLLNTEPRFSLVAKQLQISGGDNERRPVDVEGIPTGSPAWRWLQARAPVLFSWQVRFHDPHEGRGGAGASGAQFVLVHALTTWLQFGLDWEPNSDWRSDVWRDYQVLAEGLGSGADILGQIVGKVAHVNLATKSSEPLAWPFSDLSVTIARTGKKMQTHEHLRSFDKRMVGDLELIVLDAKNAFLEAKQDDFIDSVKRFASELRRLELQTSETTELLGKLAQRQWCLAAKGCGAMGCDMILVLHRKAQRPQVVSELEQLGLQFFADESGLSDGLKLERVH